MIESIKNQQVQKELNYSTQIDIQNKETNQLLEMLENEKQSETELKNQIIQLTQECDQYENKEKQLQEANSIIENRLQNYTNEELQLRMRLECVLLS